VATILHNFLSILLLVISGLSHTRIKLVHHKDMLLNGIHANFLLRKMRSWSH